PDLTASMQCERAPEPGRVRCSVEAHAKPGRSLAWADVALIELPEFTSALRGRIGPDGVVSKDAASEKWAFGLVARGNGQGDARARVRAVLCDVATPARCAPHTVDVRATIHVG